MVTRILFFVFLLMATSNANAPARLFIVEKSFDEVQRNITEYFSTKNYKIIETNEKIFEIYFDLPELLYLKQGGYIRYKAVQYLTKKKKKKYKENIEYSQDLNTTYNFPVKHYNNVKTFEEKHPLLRLVKRKERQYFLDRLKLDGVNYPMRLKEIIQVSKLVHTFEIYSNSFKIGSISINKMESSAFNNKTKFLMLEIDLKNNLDLIDDLSSISGITYDNNVPNEYILAFVQMKKNISLFTWILKYPYIINLLYGVVYGLTGLLLIFFLFRKRLF